jgi:hypothetical protein
MQKTGESYTTARASLLRTRAARSALSEHGASQQQVSDPTTATPAPASQDFARVAGMSDAKLKEKTGCAWDRWVWSLDAVNAHAWPHTEIARYVREKYEVPGWWAQAVTVGYERIRGLREKGQRRSGVWEASKSRTIDTGAGKALKAFTQPKVRRQWLDAAVVLRTSVPNKSARLTWPDGTSVEVYLTPKGRTKTAVSVTHSKLASKAAAETQKAYWTERLDVLAGILAPGSR